MNWLESIYSDGTEDFVIPVSPCKSEKVVIKLRLYRENPVHRVLLRSSPEGEEILKEMVVDKEDDIFIYYRTEEYIHNKVFTYRFLLEAGGHRYWYNQSGTECTTPLDIYDFRIITGLASPKWLQKSIFYQIFPDRFACGLEPKLPNYTYLNRKPTLKKWHEKPGEYQETYCMDFFGGNISGIFNKIPYLQELGINALYFNPVFHSPSNHRYDVQDYFKIDPVFGDNSSFAILSKRLQQNNIKVVLDGVFNHSGMACRWFNKAKYYDEVGAYQSQKSEYASFYCFKRHPHNYHSWQGVDTLPKFNYACNKLRDMIYRSTNSIMQYWLQEPYSIDGWRIDAANMLGRSPGCEDYLTVWQELRKAIKDRFPDSYILGEHFFDASDLLQGNALDAAMNYQGFTFPVRKWLVEGFSSENLDKQLCTFRAAISWQVVLNQYNLLNSHDIPRLSFLLPCRKLQKLAAIFLFTYPGVPAIYYGEEIGLAGGSSCESSRLPMLWDNQDLDMLEFYQKIIALRKDSQVLQKGGIKTIYVKNDVYCYARFLEKKVIIVALNRGEECRINIDLKKVNVLPNTKLQSWENNRTVCCDENGRLSVTISKSGYFVGMY
ncbi:alpha amylase N-terminal ig-like domain-containing protein [Candidatus Uabimicrobium sp. HlEnr_7]|uniref:alpha amylase N-terminal ig-like domain-containing protein n=1 Tax=Candidatus Uabimicrobium helgolandensis TaxID=3095367 RepID=UPI0035579971